MAIIDVTMEVTDGTVERHGNLISKQIGIVISCFYCLLMPLPFPNRPRSIITPMAIISIPLNEDTPPKDKVAQQKPNVVVGRKNKPAIGITGFGTPKASNG